MGSYSETAASAKKLLTKKGQQVTRRAYTEGTYDPATSTASVVTTDSTRVGVLFDFGSGQSHVRGSLIVANDKRLLLDADATVNQQDHFIVGGREYTIVSVGEINPAGISVLFDLHLRAG